MPLKYFDCPDGQRREVAECLDMCPRTEGRCLSLPTLYDIGWQREWTGKPSTTQLLKPTRLAYLEITTDYSIKPEDRAFSLLGTRHHRRLELVAKKLEGVEAEKFLDGDETGILDLIEPDELHNGSFKLIDYKTWGSYAVAKRLSDENGNGDYDRRQTEFQLNNYRIKVERLGFPISRMFVQCTVRDGGTFTAKNNKILSKILLMPIQKIDDEVIKVYFELKRRALLSALKNETMPDFCSYDDRWANRRCLGFCDVVEFCPEGAAMKKLGTKDA